MKKINSKLFENFNKNEIDQSSLIVGGRTSKRKDCNASSYEADNSTWRSDSTDKSDTVRADDGCNESIMPDLPATPLP